MKTFRLRLRPLGSFITPFKADTLFGGVCWSVLYRHGQGPLDILLDAYRSGEPPFVLSNGFPGNLFPRPRLPFVDSPVTRSDRLRTLKEAKRVKKIDYLDTDEFHALCVGKIPEIKAKRTPFLTASSLHNQICRTVGRAAGEGGLYSQDETYLDPEYQYLSVYLKVQEEYVSLILEAFEALGRTGLGKRKSAGRGAFIVEGFEEYAFPKVDGANAFISLSDFVPAPGDPVEGSYALSFKYGKLGEEYGLRFHPFKRPLILLRAGAWFRLTGETREYYGRMVSGIAPDLPQVLHHGLAFSVAIRMPGI